MGAVHESITSELAEWISQQRVFFVSSAPLSGDGHVNCSPKGLDSFRVLGPSSVAYLDLTGSGAETIAHVRENGRIVLMFCALEGPPRILRLHGRGTVFLPTDAQFAKLRPSFPEMPGIRSIIHIDVTRVSTSCGFGVPTFGEAKDRVALNKYNIHKGEAALVDYRRRKNAVSIDGLPAFPLEA